MGRAVFLSGRHGHGGRTADFGLCVRAGPRLAPAPAAHSGAGAGHECDCRTGGPAGRPAPACALLAFLCPPHALVVDEPGCRAHAHVCRAVRVDVRAVVAGQAAVDAPAGACTGAVHAQHRGLHGRRNHGHPIAPAVEHAVGTDQSGTQRLAGHRGHGLCALPLSAPILAARCCSPARAAQSGPVAGHRPDRQRPDLGNCRHRGPEPFI